MTSTEQKRALACSITAAKSAGELMNANQFATKKIDFASQHDIKLALDVKCQQLIENRLRDAFPQVAVVGEEGVQGDSEAPQRWVIDPIDGTVNFTYGIPHACVSIALQEKGGSKKSEYPDGYTTILGVVYDPFCNELWSAIRGQPARLNGRKIQVSRRRSLNDCIVSIGFAKTRENLEATLPYFNKLVHRVRKIRMMGSAALALTYVACGRFDAYVESGIRLWDVAAGGLIVQCAGGEFWQRPTAGEHAYRMIASNGLLRKTLRVPEPPLRREAPLRT